VGIAQAPFEIDPYLEVLLQIADSSITYRTRYLTNLRTDFVLELLLGDETNPRSVAFQVAMLLHHTKNLPHRESSLETPLELGITKRLHASMQEWKIDDLATRDENGDLRELEDLFKHLKTGLYDFSDALTARYLSHLTPSRLVALF
jgi:uncharacterized alpha-E superfamily protein